MGHHLRSVCVAVLTLTCTLNHSFAAGFEVPEIATRSVSRGGAVAARVDDPSAAVINPGALSRVEGIMFQYNHNLMWVDSSFMRLDPQEEGAYLPELKNKEPFFPLGIFASLSYDLGTDHSVMAFTVNGPNTTGHTDFSDEDSTRYLLNEFDTLLLYYSLSYAYGTDTFGVGLTAQWVQVPRLNFAITVDAMPLANGLAVSPVSSPFDVQAELQLEDKGTLSGLIGGWWRPVPNIDVAIAARPLPIRVELAGKADVRIPELLASQLEISETTASLAMDLPPHLRVGFRYRHLQGEHELFDIEFDALVEQWSSLKRYDAKLTGTVTANIPGIGTLDLQDVIVGKHWEDTVSLRLGGSYWIEPETIEVSAGGFWESAAAPTAYTHLDFPAGERLGYGVGASWFPMVSGTRKKDGVKLGLSLALSEAFQKDINVGAGQGRVYQQRPLRPCPEFCNDSPGVAVNEGRFKTQWRTVSLGISVQGF
jgi:long-subunit fatty acid transport protein